MTENDPVRRSAGLPGPRPALAAERKPLPKDLPPFGEDKPLPKPALAVSTLPNGLTVWTWPRPGVPRFVAVLAVRGGTAADPKGMEGIAELLADTLKEGTATRTSRRIAEELQSVGGEITASAADDAIYVSVNGLASGAPPRRSTCWPTWPARRRSRRRRWSWPRATPSRACSPASPPRSSWPRRPSPGRSSATTPTTSWPRRRRRSRRRPPRRSGGSSRAASGPRARSSWWSATLTPSRPYRPP